MNWEFHAVTKTDSTELIAEYRQLAVEGIEFWLDHGFEWPEKQPEAGYSEKPKGFFSEGPWYNYRMTVWGEGPVVMGSNVECWRSRPRHRYRPSGCLNPPEYDVIVNQTFYPVFDKAVWDEYVKKGLRVRKISRVAPIE